MQRRFCRVRTAAITAWIATSGLIVCASAAVTSAQQLGRGPAAGTCGDDPFRLIEIRDAAELSQKMGIQRQAARFLAGTRGEDGGSLTGEVFADYGVAAEWVGELGKQGKVASELWGEFSKVVMGSAEAFAHLYPSKMDLHVRAAPVTFPEDSTERGSWKVGATAATEVWNLTDKILQEALALAMKNVTLDPVLERGSRSIDREGLTPGQKRLLELAEEVASEELGGDAAKDFTAEQLSAFLEAIGANEGMNGFYLPPQCWEVHDGWDEWSEAELEGDAFRLEGERGYVPVKAGPAVLRVWTVEGRRAFGNTTFTERIDLEVRPIEIDLSPAVQSVEPGAEVPFIAAVTDALDTDMSWSTTAGTLSEPQYAGEGMETAVLTTPNEPKVFPITVRVDSTSRAGPRGRHGAPPRFARAVVQLTDPVIEVSPPGGCVEPGGRLQLSARVYGVEDQRVTWSADRARVTDDGSYRAPGSETADTVTASWVHDPDVSTAVEVRVGGCGPWARVSFTGVAAATFETDEPPPSLRIAGDMGKRTCRPTLEIVSGDDYVLLTGLLRAPIAPGTYPIVDGPPKAGQVAAQFRPSCRREGNCDRRAYAPDDALSGSLFVERLDAELMVGRFEAVVERHQPDGSDVTYQAVGQFRATVSGPAGFAQLSADHLCMPSDE